MKRFTLVHCLLFGAAAVQAEDWYSSRFAEREFALKERQEGREKRCGW